jgi:oligopeptide transport system ATP-binding protein
MRSIPMNAESPPDTAGARASVPLLAIDALDVHFTTPDGDLVAVAEASLSLGRGECLGIVGESGSGKSQLVLAATGLLAPNGRASGSVRLDGLELLGADRATWRSVHGRRIGFVFQDPMSALAPHLSIGAQLTETIRAHARVSRAAARARALALLGRVRMPDPGLRLRQYPHELSGGLRQRAMIAVALAAGPELLIADEPTTALDVTVQRRVLDLFRELRRELGMALVLITHDLGVVAGLCDRVLVMYAGRIVEEGPVEALFAAPRHPYTAALLAASPRSDDPPDAPFATIPGAPPDPRRLPEGCAFRPRCARSVAACAKLQGSASVAGVRVACHRPMVEARR